MNVKGTALTTTRDFVKTNFPEKFNEFIESLPPVTKSYYTSTLDATKWYPLKEGYLIPIKMVIDLCFKGDIPKGADAIGRFSADVALKGFYKVFLLIASPGFMIKRASKIFSTFYDPSEINVIEQDSNHATLRIIQFDEIDSALEYRIAGWIVRALELANCREPHYEFGKRLSKGDEFTDIRFGWS
ncbi:MAG: hypothetical protein JW723_03180 [Bacteroidales bacterium]|nr:hypothetical protein [Bacteroidales bacterium]